MVDNVLMRITERVNEYFKLTRVTGCITFGYIVLGFIVLIGIKLYFYGITWDGPGITLRTCSEHMRTVLWCQPWNDFLISVLGDAHFWLELFIWPIRAVFFILFPRHMLYD